MKSHKVKALIAACADYYTATAKALKEDGELLKAGFEYVTERDEVKIYRKRK